MGDNERINSRGTAPKSGLAATLLVLICVGLFYILPLFTGKGVLPSILGFISSADAQQPLTQDQTSAMSAELQMKYFGNLDRWVSLGGDVQSIQNNVVQTCGKLALTYGTAAENAALLVNAEELSFRADVCTKMTINKVHRQPEFDNAKIISTICDGKQPFYEALCKHFGHR